MNTEKFTNSPTVVSLFSGCGGLDLGFHELGFDLVYACDNDPAAIRVFKENIGDRAFVRDVTSDEFHSEIASLGSCDIVLGGFPCQGFSKAGPKKSDDPRNFLYLEMKKAVEVLRPKIFLAENVDGLSQNFKGAYLNKIVSDFRSIGYHVEYKILDVATFGVPQHRRRIIFVGTEESLGEHVFELPISTHITKGRNGERTLSQQHDLFESRPKIAQEQAVTIAKSIGDLSRSLGSLDDHKYSENWPVDYRKILRKIGIGQKLCNVRFSPSSVYTWEIPEVFGDVDESDIAILEAIGKNRRHKQYGDIPNGNPIPELEIIRLTGQENIKSSIRKLLEQGYLKEKNGGYDLKGAMFCSGLFKRPHLDSLSPTVLTNFCNPRYFVHPTEDRPFTLRECARLQGFPDTFRFLSDESEKALIDGYRLVGNAVPPPVSRAFASSVSSMF